MNVLLDLDGTLTDPREGIANCINYALASLGEPCRPEADFLRFIGPPLHASFDVLLGAASSRTTKAVALYRERFSGTGLFENKVYPGIPDALASLGERGAVLIVATSKMTAFAERIVEHFSLGRYIRAIHGSERDGTRSNKAELIAHVLKAERLAATDTRMVGDREHDMIGARANGVFGIGALWGYGSREELHNAGASVLCERPAELARILSSDES